MDLKLIYFEEFRKQKKGYLKGQVEELGRFWTTGFIWLYLFSFPICVSYLLLPILQNWFGLPLEGIEGDKKYGKEGGKFTFTTTLQVPKEGPNLG